jgi:hypothetical protein
MHPSTRSLSTISRSVMKFPRLLCLLSQMDMDPPYLFSWCFFRGRYVITHHIKSNGMVNARDHSLISRFVLGLRVGFKGELFPLSCQFHEDHLCLTFRVGRSNACLPRQFSETLCTSRGGSRGSVMDFPPSRYGSGLMPSILQGITGRPAHRPRRAFSFWWYAPGGTFLPTGAVDDGRALSPDPKLSPLRFQSRRAFLFALALGRAQLL